MSIFRSKVGNYSWVLGHDCKCGANISPAFVLDMTGLIFKTGGRHLHTRGPGQDRRQPVVVWLTLTMALLHSSMIRRHHGNKKIKWYLVKRWGYQFCSWSLYWNQTYILIGSWEGFKVYHFPVCSWKIHSSLDILKKNVLQGIKLESFWLNVKILFCKI